MARIINRSRRLSLQVIRRQLWVSASSSSLEKHSKAPTLSNLSGTPGVALKRSSNHEQPTESDDKDTTALATQQDSFTIQIHSKHISSGPRTSKPTTFSCTMFVTITSTTSLSEFKQIFQKEALQHYFPHLQPDDEEEVPEGVVRLHPEAVIPGKQSVKMELLLRNDDEKIKVVFENWECIVERLRLGEKLTVVWCVQFDSGFNELAWI